MLIRESRVNLGLRVYLPDKQDTLLLKYILIKDYLYIFEVNIDGQSKKKRSAFIIYIASCTYCGKLVIYVSTPSWVPHK